MAFENFFVIDEHGRSCGVSQFQWCEVEEWDGSRARVVVLDRDDDLGVIGIMYPDFVAHVVDLSYFEDIVRAVRQEWFVVD